MTLLTDNQAKLFKMTNLKRTGLFFFCLFSLFIATAQNLVPNHSFEEVNFVRKGSMWKTSNGEEFGLMSVDWVCPHSSSPDYLDHENGRKYIFKEYNVKLSNYRAIDGNKHIGISVYGSHRSSRAGREYPQIKLSKSLEKGKKYYVEFWVSRIRNSSIINNIGAYFSEERPTSIHLELEGFQPQILKKEVIGEKPFKWEKISGKFTAQGNYQYLSIGNFFTDEQTQLFDKNTSGRKIAYYFLDNVLVEEVSGKKKDSSELEFGKTYTLNEVNFEFAKSDILDKSYSTLNKLHSFLLQHSGSKVEITGHADNLGTAEFNMKLSKERATAIRSFLIKKGIGMERISIQSRGDLEPVASNETEEGRKQNRRVEFRIVGN